MRSERLLFHGVHLDFTLLGPILSLRDQKREIGDPGLCLYSGAFYKSNPSNTTNSFITEKLLGKLVFFLFLFNKWISNWLVPWLYGMLQNHEKGTRRKEKRRASQFTSTILWFGGEQISKKYIQKSPPLSLTPGFRFYEPIFLVLIQTVWDVLTRILKDPNPSNNIDPLRYSQIDTRHV